MVSQLARRDHRASPAEPLPAEREPSERLTYLDNLRVVLIASIIAAHAFLGYATVGGTAAE